jgi:tetratricopeptide (TPR) repeat protein
VPPLLAGFALGMVTMLGLDRARARLGHGPAAVAPAASFAARSGLADGRPSLPSALPQHDPATRAAAGGEPAPIATPAASTASPARAQPNRKQTERAALFAFAHEQQRRLRLEDAQRIYEGVLRVRPADAEALCGLAELALLRGDSNRAEALYERALQLHGDYAPAWLGSADIAWQRGDQARAARLYQTVTARFPEGAYPPYAEQRAQEPTAQADAPQARPRCDK